MKQSMMKSIIITAMITLCVPNFVQAVTISAPSIWTTLKADAHFVTRSEFAVMVAPLLSNVSTKSIKCTDCKVNKSVLSAIEKSVNIGALKLIGTNFEPSKTMSMESAGIALVTIIGKEKLKSLGSQTDQSNWISTATAQSSIKLLRTHGITTAVSDYRKPLNALQFKQWLQQVLTALNTSPVIAKPTPLPTPLIVTNTTSPSAPGVGDEALPTPGVDIVNYDPNSIKLHSNWFRENASPFPVKLTDSTLSDVSVIVVPDSKDPHIVVLKPTVTLNPGKYQIVNIDPSASSMPVSFEIDMPYIQKIRLEKTQIMKTSNSIIPLRFEDQYSREYHVNSNDIGIAIIDTSTNQAYSEKPYYDETEKRFRVDMSGGKIGVNYWINVIHRSGLMANGMIDVVNQTTIDNIILKSFKTSVSDSSAQTTLQLNVVNKRLAAESFTRVTINSDQQLTISNPLSNLTYRVKFDGIGLITDASMQDDKLIVKYALPETRSTIDVSIQAGAVQLFKTIYTFPITEEKKQ